LSAPAAHDVKYWPCLPRVTSKAEFRIEQPWVIKNEILQTAQQVLE